MEENGIYLPGKNKIPKFIPCVVYLMEEEEIKI